MRGGYHIKMVPFSVRRYLKKSAGNKQRCKGIRGLDSEKGCSFLGCKHD